MLERWHGPAKVSQLMRKHPLVSVIVPTYNAAPWLDECLSSVLRQTCGDFECIVVDDGSKDGTVDKVRNYAARDARLRVFTQPHEGPGSARNLGLSRARGKYLYFLDADDFIEGTLLERCVDAMQEHAADMCIFDIFEHDACKQTDRLPTWCLKQKYLPENNPFSAMMVSRYIFNIFSNYVWNKFFRHQFVIDNEITFHEILRTEDLIFTSKALVAAKRIYVLNERLVHYRVNNRNSSINNNELYYTDFIYAFHRLKKYLCECKKFQTYVISYVNHKIDGSVFNLFSMQQEKIFTKLFLLLQLWLKDVKLLTDISVFNIRKYSICQDILTLPVRSFIAKYASALRWHMA